jgi:hypothetical protein
MSENGRLPKSDLAPIPQGELRKDAAAAWNAKQGPADNGLYPTGSMSSYRTYDEQVYLYRLYQEGKGNLAADPGTSNHGWGVAVDLALEWMRSWIDDHGARFGWRKTEAFSEWWHVNFVGGVSFPTFEVLRRGSRGKRVRWYTKRLAFIHKPGGHAYLPRWYWRFRDPVVDAVIAFQSAQKLKPDGAIGEKTAHQISVVFHKQYVSRKGKRKRRLRDIVRRRP